MQSKHITFVADELLGYHRCGGLGTATTLDALALAEAGHRVDMLYTGVGEETSDPEWRTRYADAGIVIRRPGELELDLAPAFLEKSLVVARNLLERAPDVVVSQDLGAPCVVALRLRELGLGLADTTFVIRCSGTRRWVAYASRKPRVLPGALAVSLLERESFELADVVVSANEYMLDWMRGQGWRLPPHEFVIPYLTRRHELGVQADGVTQTHRLAPRRLAFFGRLEVRKGIRIFLEALEALDPELLRGVEVAFFGTATAAWTPARILEDMSERVRTTLGAITFETELGRSEALAALAQPGTLVVMPSLEDNSPNTVVECVVLGLPFLASSAGGTSELVAPEDRERVLFEPTVDGLVEALERVLRAGTLPAAAAPAYDQEAALTAWDEVVRFSPSAPSPRPETSVERIDVVVTSRGSRQALARCLQALARQEGVDAKVVVALAGPRVPEPSELPAGVDVVRATRSTFEAARQAGLEAGAAPLVCFLDEEDVPDPDLLVTLARARASSGADVVTCGLRLREADRERVHLFLGEPGGLGVLENAYGTVALVRRSLLRDLSSAWPSEHDPDWVLLARLRLQGARIVSVPRPLVTTSRRPGTVDGAPGDALLVAGELERAYPEPLENLARLALAIGESSPAAAADAGIISRGIASLRTRGLLGTARHTGAKVLHAARGSVP